MSAYERWFTGQAALAGLLAAANTVAGHVGHTAVDTFIAAAFLSIAWAIGQTREDRVGVTSR